MDKLIERVAAYNRRYQLWQAGDHLLVACSGGPDSLSLLDVLARLAPRDQLTLTACYVHHGLRPDAAQEVERVRQEAQKRHCGFACQYVDIPALVKKEHRSAEALGHRERYRIFRETARAVGAVRIAVAHQADDQAETVLLHLLRGTGLAGLTAMAPVRDDIIRPFLFLTKAEIAAYAKARRLPVCHDETNDLPIYQRNRIRLELLPFLQTYNPAIRADLNRLAEILQADEAYLDEAARLVYQKFVQHVDKCARIAKKKILAQPLAMQRRLIRLMWQEVTGSPRNLPFHYVETMRLLAQKGAGKEFQSGQARAYTTHTDFCLGPAQSQKPRHYSSFRRKDHASGH